VEGDANEEDPEFFHCDGNGLWFGYWSWIYAYSELGFGWQWQW
jgi:hypothetical protein